MTAKNGKGRNEWVESFFELIFFSFNKKERIKINWNSIRNLKKVTLHIPTIFLSQLKYNLQKSYCLKNQFFNIFPSLPFTGFTDFTSKFHFFYQFTRKFKTSGGELLELLLLDMRLVNTSWPIRPVFTFIDNCSNLVNPACRAVVKKGKTGRQCRAVVTSF